MKLPQIRSKLIVFICIGISLIMMASPAMALVWKAAQTIASSDSTNNRESPAFAIQTNGVAHVAYSKYKGTHNNKAEIVYKTNKSGVWQEEVITSNSVADDDPSVSVYARKPRIVFHRGKAATNKAEIIYMIKTDGVWKTSRITKNGYPDDFPKIATNKGKDHIAWVGYRGGISDDGDIYYKTNATDSGKWRGEKVTNNAIEESEPDIAVNGLRRAHIAYTGIDADGDTEIFYASKRSGGQWNIKKVTDNTGVDDHSPAIALHKGRAYIAFFRKASANSKPQLYLAKKVKRGWDIQRLSKDRGGVYGRPWIKVNRGVVRIVFARYTIKTKTFDVYYLLKSSSATKKRRIDKKGDDSLASGIGVAKGMTHTLYASWNFDTDTGGIYYRKQR